MDTNYIKKKNLPSQTPVFTGLNGYKMGKMRWNSSLNSSARQKEKVLSSLSAPTIPGQKTCLIHLTGWKP